MTALLLRTLMTLSAETEVFMVWTACDEHHMLGYYTRRAAEMLHISRLGMCLATPRENQGKASWSASQGPKAAMRTA